MRKEINPSFDFVLLATGLWILTIPFSYLMDPNLISALFILVGIPSCFFLSGYTRRVVKSYSWTEEQDFEVSNSGFFDNMLERKILAVPFFIGTVVGVLVIFLALLAATISLAVKLLFDASWAQEVLNFINLSDFENVLGGALAIGVLLALLAIPVGIFLEYRDLKSSVQKFPEGYECPTHNIFLFLLIAIVAALIVSFVQINFWALISGSETSAILLDVDGQLLFGSLLLLLFVGQIFLIGYHIDEIIKKVPNQEHTNTKAP